MKAILKIEERNFESDIPSSEIGAVVSGSKVVTIKTKWDSKDRTFHLDVKNFAFEQGSIILEGPISNETELLGRCVVRITDIGVLAKGRSK
jgi:hypothetical protein|tara:strand:- start:233 stop:505 length:273 start_codon:yes stop_codon:yes gene_type:complete